MVFCNIEEVKNLTNLLDSHNPYFNRWFSAINKVNKMNNNKKEVTILILIDGFLQWR